MGEARYNVRIADREYWREQIKCQYACSVHTDARGYVRALAAGDYERAYLIARGTQSSRFPLRAHLRRSLRGGVPPGQHRPAHLDSSAEAVCLRKVRERRPQRRKE